MGFDIGCQLNSEVKPDPRKTQQLEKNTKNREKHKN